MAILWACTGVFFGVAGNSTAMWACVIISSMWAIHRDRK